MRKNFIAPCLLFISFIINSIIKIPSELIEPISYIYLSSLSFNINNILSSLRIYSGCKYISFSKIFIISFSFKNNKFSSFIKVKFET